MAQYTISVDGEQVAVMEADFAQASSPIKLDGDSTPYQVADSRHRPQEAAEMLLLWSWSQGGPLCDVDNTGDNAEIIGDVTIERIVE